MVWGAWEGGFQTWILVSVELGKSFLLFGPQFQHLQWESGWVRKRWFRYSPYIAQCTWRVALQQTVWTSRRGSALWSGGLQSFVMYLLNLTGGFQVLHSIFLYALFCFSIFIVYKQSYPCFFNTILRLISRWWKSSMQSCKETLGFCT